MLFDASVPPIPENFNARLNVDDSPPIVLSNFITAPGSILRTVTLGFNDLFNGSDDNAIIITAGTDLGDTIVVTIAEPGDANLTGADQTGPLRVPPRFM